MSAWSAFTNAFKRPQALRGSAVGGVVGAPHCCLLCCVLWEWSSCQWEREWGQLPTPEAGSRKGGGRRSTLKKAGSRKAVPHPHPLSSLLSPLSSSG
jgi:hypothetical protein